MNNCIYLRANSNTFNKKILSTLLDTHFDGLLFKSQDEVGIPQSDHTCYYDPNLLLNKANHLFKKTTNLAVRKWVEVKDLYMHMLLCINEYFDDDMLMEAFDALDYI